MVQNHLQMDNCQENITAANRYSQNPRKITATQLNQLTGHLEKFGDLGGIVYCRNNKAYIGGNQRSTIFDGAQVNYIKTYPTPLPDKTVALGFIEWKGNQYFYREVEFTEQEFREACIAANNDGGDWDIEVFRMSWTKDELEQFGFNTSDFDDSVFQDDEELKITSSTFEPTASLEYLKFANYKIPLSEIELAGLNKKADDYYSIHGTLLGFAQTLIDHA